MSPQRKSSEKVVLSLVILLGISVLIMEGLVFFVVVVADAPAADKFKAISDNIGQLITALLGGVIGWLVGQRNGAAP